MGATFAWEWAPPGKKFADKTRIRNAKMEVRVFMRITSYAIRIISAARVRTAASN